MVAPGVGFIEIAADWLPRVPAHLAELQRKELHMFGSVRAQSIGASGLSDDFMVGYELGLATLRVMLKGNPAAVQAGVDL